ncbi:MAG TPA: winged helix-turn-helix domain-containing protein [Nevskia sp.]|nr:winged helix-turn-helix domain-containing protein [Nevskia sp.]
MDASGEASYRFGPFHVDGGARLLLRENQPVALAPKAFDLLCYLLAHPHRLIGKDELLKAVWPRGFVEEGNLSHNIFLLRRALGESPEEHRYIVTVPGRGYKFVGQLQPQAAAPAAASATAPGPDALSLALGGGQPGQVYSITAGDFNGDGKLDLAVVNQLDGTVSVLLNATEPGDRLSFAPAVKLGNPAVPRDPEEGPSSS